MDINQLVIITTLLFTFAEVSNSSHECDTRSDICPNVKIPFSVSRKRRYLTFPTGSVISLLVQMIKTLTITTPTGWMVAEELEALYKLPDIEFARERIKNRRKLKHRDRREMWSTLENLLHGANFDAKSCLRRAACETRQNLAPPGVSLVHDLLRSIFGQMSTRGVVSGAVFMGIILFLGGVASDNFCVPVGEDPNFKEQMDSEYHKLLDEEHCLSKVDFDSCPLSILNIAYGSELI